MIMECSYAVTAWTQAVEDEHRLLSQVLGVLFAFPQLPDDALAGRLAETARRFAIEGKIGQAKADGKADFWSAVGGQYKASLDYVVTLACESGVAYERGPEVRTQTVLPRMSDGPASTIHEMHRFGGKVVDADGAPLADVWVTLPGARAVRRLRPAGPLPARPRARRHARAGRAHPRRPRGQGGDRRARRGARPARWRAPKRRQEEGGMTEWAPIAARTAAPALWRTPAPTEDADGMPPDDSAGRACCWGTSSRWCGWA